MKGRLSATSVARCTRVSGCAITAVHPDAAAHNARRMRELQAQEVKQAQAQAQQQQGDKQQQLDGKQQQGDEQQGEQLQGEQQQDVQRLASELKPRDVGGVDQHTKVGYQAMPSHSAIDDQNDNIGAPGAVMQSCLRQNTWSKPEGMKL